MKLVLASDTYILDADEVREVHFTPSDGDDGAKTTVIFKGGGRTYCYDDEAITVWHRLRDLWRPAEEAENLMTHEERKRRDREHLIDPEVGDYWNEMFTPICVVLGRVGDSVVICRTTKDVGPDHWTWDTTRIETKTLAEFRDWLSYKGDGPLREQAWASVVPGAHAWARDAAKAALFGEEG
jgi:hypothetical protein